MFLTDIICNNLGDNQSTGTRNCPTIGDVVSSSLPDFLTDGAVMTQSNEVASSEQSPDRECDRLRHELEVMRWHLSEQTRRVNLLQRDLEVAMNKEREYTQNLGRALEQVESNLERSNVSSLIISFS